MGGVSKLKACLLNRDKALKLKISHRNLSKVLKYFKAISNLKIKSLHPVYIFKVVLYKLNTFFILCNHRNNIKQLYIHRYLLRLDEMGPIDVL